MPLTKLIITLFVLTAVGCDQSAQNNRQALDRFRSNGTISATASNIMIRDSHGGFHGDGLLFLAFTDYQSTPRFATTATEWKMAPLDSRAKMTFDVVIKKFDIPSDSIPNISSPSFRYMIDDNHDRRDSHTGHLFMKDTDTHRYWYMNWTE